MSNQGQSSELDDEVAEANLRKLKLEISSLEWQNSRFGMVSRLTTLITVTITVFTLIATLIGWGLDRIKERELRTRELTERIENQYRTNIQQVVRYPTDMNQTIPSVIFIFNDLCQLGDKGYQGEHLAKRRLEVGTYLGELTKSQDFDLTKSRNVEFDYAALQFCSYYTEFLAKNPLYVKVLLEKYAVAIAPFPKENEKLKYVERTTGAHRTFYVNRPIDDRERESFFQKLRQFATMVKAYELHLNLLNRSIQEGSGNADLLRKDIERATCDFLESTQNRLLTKDVFKVDDAELNARFNKCRQQALPNI